MGTQEQVAVEGSAKEAESLSGCFLAVTAVSWRRLDSWFPWTWLGQHPGSPPPLLAIINSR